VFPDDDPTAAERKKDHIELAFKSQVTAAMLDERFYYEPLLSAHPNESSAWPEFTFLVNPLGLFGPSRHTGNPKWQAHRFTQKSKFRPSTALVGFPV
ncbi:MAG: hypothetical protein AAFO02_04425, partial [Bacteroidota bacterium]